MWRKTLCAALAASMLFAPLAEARTLVVVAQNDYSVDPAADMGSLFGMLDGVVGPIRMTGGECDVVYSHGVRTIDLVTGVYQNRSYGAVIVLPESDGTSGSMRGDSLSFTASLPSVPILYITHGNRAFHNLASSESTGVATSGEVQPQQSEFTEYLTGYGPAFKSNSRASYVMASGYRGFNGGIRPIIGGNTSQGVRMRPGSTGWPCVDCDSTVRTDDTLRIWVRNNSHKAGAAPQIFCAPGHLWGAEASPEILLQAIGLLDSLSGHAVLGDRQIKIGFHVRGGWSRATALSSGGFPESDSAAIKASIDSLASLDVPFVVGFNPDSLNAYPRDKAWWTRASKARFTPHPLVAINDTTIGKNAGAQSLVDPMGRYRSRTAIGDGSLAGADTSIASLWRRALWKADSAFGRNRVSRVMMPPANDWLPLNWTGMTPDSAIAALADAGFVGLVSNVRLRQSSIRYGGTNPLGDHPTQRSIPVRFGARAGSDFRILATPGHMDSGSVRFGMEAYGGGSDGGVLIPTLERTEMFWRGLLTDRTLEWRVKSTAAVSTVRKANADSLDSPVCVYTIHAGDLGSGTRSDASTRPIRPGWWQIKNIVNAAKIVNKVAGRNVIAIVDPQEIEP